MKNYEVTRKLEELPRPGGVTVRVISIRSTGIYACFVSIKKSLVLEKAADDQFNQLKVSEENQRIRVKM